MAGSIMDPKASCLQNFGGKAKLLANLYGSRDMKQPRPGSGEWAEPIILHALAFSII